MCHLSNDGEEVIQRLGYATSDASCVQGECCSEAAKDPNDNPWFSRSVGTGIFRGD